MKVKIDHMGTQGDGVAILENGDKIYVPFVLTGEEVEVDTAPKKPAKLKKVLSPSPARIEAPCPHFGTCGGCSLQHVELETYESFKKQKIQTELLRHGIDFPVVEGVFLPAGTRRRTSLKAKRFGSKVVLGYMAKGTNDLVDVSSCLVLDESLQKLLTPLRNVLSEILGKKHSAEIWMTASKSGVDMKIFAENLDNISLESRLHLTEFAKEQRLARLTVVYNRFDDPIVQFHQPFEDFSGIVVPVSCDTFLQASLEADSTLADFVRSHLPHDENLRVADLFCGRGTLTFACGDAVVDAYEADRPSLDILAQAAKQSGKKVQTHLRNLFAEPLAGDELGKLDAVVLDPPRAGAKAQCEALAEGTVSRIIYISCNPASFARDAKSLVNGGYKLVKCVALDQFIYSSHVEVMSVFEK